MDQSIKIAQIGANNQEVPFKYFAWSEKIMGDIFAGKTYTPVKQVQEVRTIFDVGANVGAASIYFLMRYPDVRVYAFEPAPDAFQILKENAAYFPNIKVENIGLFNETKSATLYLSRVDPVTHSIGQSALNKPDGVEVALVDVDSYIREHKIGRIDVLKMDTEGCEVPIIQSLSDHIAEISVIYLEYHSEEDRLFIDQRLNKTHVLAGGQIPHPHKGELCYLNKRYLDAELEALRIKL